MLFGIILNDEEVHSDPAMGNVTKFSYLNGQLSFWAPSTILGLRITNGNYEKAVELLKERYGRTEHLISAHFGALCGLQWPSKKLAGFRGFYDSLESHIRGLDAL